ncbi:MAG: RsmD family RNA methyltransferase [Candidatus Melainabacteria bacterium]|jgi:16S rRNA (guanine966-N2)-methyltransferase
MKLKVPAHVRPTMGKVKEAIFNILRSEISIFTDLKCLDLFAGSGSLGFKALELGANSLIAIDSHKDSIQALKENAEKYKFLNKTKIIKADCLKYDFVNTENLPHKFDLIFADPPYAISDEDLAILLNRIPLLTSDSGLFVLELGSGRDVSALLDNSNYSSKTSENSLCLNLLSKRVYGDTAIWFWRGAEEIF